MSMVKKITVSTNEIYQLTFLKKVVLNCSLKEAMTSFFYRAPCLLPSISKKSAKLKCLKSDFHWKPFKNDEKCFLFHLKSSVDSQRI